VDDETWIAHDSVIGELQYLFVAVLVLLICRQVVRVLKFRIDRDRGGSTGAPASATGTR
jgi:hypothetical protein